MLFFLSVIQDINVEAFVIDLLVIQVNIDFLCSVESSWLSKVFIIHIWSGNSSVISNDCLVKNSLNKTTDTTFKS